MIDSIPKIIAHRGASMFAPENTMPAFELAKKLGAEMIECDVQLSKDLVPVIFHDDTLERVTNGFGSVFDFTLNELKALRVKNVFAAPFDHVTSIQIPTLLETLEWCLHNDMKLNLELKINSLAPQSPLVAQVVALIKTLPTHLNTLMLVSSFDWITLHEFQTALPQFAVAFLVDRRHFDSVSLSDLKKISSQSQATSMNFDYHLLLKQPDLADAVKESVDHVLAYTVDDAVTAQDLFKLGVDGVFSNNPRLLYPSDLR